MKIAVAQISCSLGDPEANLIKVRDFSRRAKDEAGAEVVVFPEMYRKLAGEQKVGAFVISSAWPFPRDEHFRVLAIARAIENQSYVIASNRVGKDGDLWFCGSSAIIDPRGVVIAAASADREELIQADLSEELVRSVRQRVESLAHRREDLYR